MNEDVRSVLKVKTIQEYGLYGFLPLAIVAGYVLGKSYLTFPLLLVTIHWAVISLTCSGINKMAKIPEQQKDIFNLYCRDKSMFNYGIFYTGVSFLAYLAEWDTAFFFIGLSLAFLLSIKIPTAFITILSCLIPVITTIVVSMVAFNVEVGYVVFVMGFTTTLAGIAYTRTLAIKLE